MFKSLFDAGYKELKRVEKIANKIDALAPEYSKLTDEQLQAKTLEFRNRLKNGETLDSITVEAFATVREASTRVLGMTPFKVQLIGALALHGGNVSEMKTGEGKTLTSTLVAYLNALPGNGVHIVTVNEYLASRDAEEMGKLFTWLGLTVGLNLRALSKEEKQEQYKCDIMYSISSELGFDYLRDHMVRNKENLVQRPLNFAIIDEADSILIDEARTPLIISGPMKAQQVPYSNVDTFVKRLIGRKINATLDEEEEKLDFTSEDEYIVDVRAHHVVLTDKGARKAEERFSLNGSNLYDPENANLLHLIHNSLRANYLMTKDVDYAVQDDKVIIIDKSTGRLMHGRQYSEGLHQAIEAKENVKINKETRIVATITIQNFFRMYKKLAGMTGTAKTEEEEFRNIYNMYVVEVPTNEPMIRIDAPDYLFLTEKAKYEALVADIIERHKKGQPVLVGTSSDEMSMKVASMVRKAGAKNLEILNAKNHEKEAKIIAKAGQVGAVTIATNMAGRGTDIKLGEGVEELGGLAVLGTARNESRRVDNQLRGRSGRQGNPGYSRFYISTEDELLVRFGAERLRGTLALLVKEKGSDKETPLEYNFLSKFVENAQKKIEGLNFDSRKTILEYDEVLRMQREVIYGQREKILFVEDLSEITLNMIKTAAENLVDATVGFKKRYYEDELESLVQEIDSKFLPRGALTVEKIKDKNGEQIVEEMLKISNFIFEDKKAHVPAEQFDRYLRQLLLEAIDDRWLDHIDQMDELRQSVRLQSYAQINPLREYQEIGFQMFNEMLAEVELDIANRMNRLKMRILLTPEEHKNLIASFASGDANTQKRQPKKAEVKPGRNDPCPCGSGKKYKNCCGRNGQ